MGLANKTSFFTNIPIRTDITIKEMNLQSGPINSTKDFVQRISILNKDTLPVIKKLFVYAGSEHPHSAQKPEVLDIESMNVKNKKRK